MECRSFPTLGWLVLDWIEEWCVIPDRDEAGEAFVPTDEQAAFLLNHYRVDPAARLVQGKWRGFWVYERGSVLMRPQKWGKAPISSAWTCVEAAPDGPVLFDGWDADGQPVGRPWPTPHVQITACSEDQTDNVWRALLPMIQLGPLADVFTDSGLTRINTPGGGLIEPVTAAAVSRLGQRITASVQDQTESWLAANGGIKLADNQRRGLAGTGGRFLATPNAYDPAEGSTAQRDVESNAAGTYRDLAVPPAGSVRNKRERRKVLRSVYGDSVVERGGWIDLDRIDAEIEALLEHDPSQAERWFMNRCLATEGAAFDLEQWKDLEARRSVPHDELITIGVDGARHDDALAIVACHVKSGYVWPLEIIERPDNAGEDYAHDKSLADGAVRDAFATWNVWRLYADPQHIADLIMGWSNDFGDRRVVEWATYRKMNIAWAVREFETAVGRGELSHVGDEVLDRHVGNARRRKLSVLDDKERQMHTLSKDGMKSSRKIDGAMAAVLAWKARSDCIKAGAVFLGDEPEAEPGPVREVWVPGRALSSVSLVSSGSGDVGPLGSLS